MPKMYSLQLGAFKQSCNPPEADKRDKSNQLGRVENLSPKYPHILDKISTLNYEMEPLMKIMPKMHSLVQLL